MTQGPQDLSHHGSHSSKWSTRKKLLIAIPVLVVIIALAVGLGVGLTRSKGDDDSEQSTTPFRPAVGTSWQIQLLKPLDKASLDLDVEVFDIDLFDNEKSIVDDLHDKDRKVICYFSAGTYEDWRDDKDDFKPEDIGKELEDWADENWLDLRSENVRNIMLKRLDVAKDKGCDGVDPDNTDGYENDNGLDLTRDDSLAYLNFLADAARERNLSIGLKNTLELVEDLVDKMQWSVNEQCVEYEECDDLRPFIDAGKPVFHLEYPKGDEVNDNKAAPKQLVTSICDNPDTKQFSTLIKNMDLDQWWETCP
ncbi:hypothetical protein AJ80_04923 [Polytolypa hystricis UAMH7299]|uniref:alpha-galactosidase n=1 Tax=Polytolypa hystricis (strain UAMH7299) TaxID=1447883 RepID=A0A2B7XZI3_POLH7|nr:hypothetical protein AJ80_04923 [Polytolypa hystricis UAMH7299]